MLGSQWMRLMTLVSSSLPLWEQQKSLFLRKPTHEFLIDTIMLRSSKPPGRMSEMGQKQTSEHVR